MATVAPAQIIGCVRVCTNEQDLAAPHKALRGWASPAGLTNGDHGVTGSNKDRPGLNEAPAAVRAGDTLVLTELDRFARSPPDAQDIIEDMTTVSQELWLQTGMTMKI
jgi:DNA invertase Pin-like site-specific DNA recombinase